MLTRRRGSSKTSQRHDFAVLNADDPTSAALQSKIKARLYWFSRKSAVENGAFLKGDQIIFCENGKEQVVLGRSDIQLKGEHNIENVLAAVTMTMLAGCTAQQVRQAVSEFRAVEHRLEFVTTINGVGFYNDSKATNVDATVKALESFPGQHSHHSWRQRQRQRLHRTCSAAARTDQKGLSDWRRGGKDQLTDTRRHRDHTFRNAGTRGAPGI